MASRPRELPVSVAMVQAFTNTLALSVENTPLEPSPLAVSFVKLSVMEEPSPTARAMEFTP